MSGPSPSHPPRLEDATLREWVERWVIETPAAPAVLSESGNVDYDRVHAKALALAAFLRDLGIGAVQEGKRFKKAGLVDFH